MEGAERDSTQEWLLPASKTPPRLDELELRVDEALAIARSSEEAVTVIGGAALEAAEQARRAAGLAERASAVAIDARRRVEERTVVMEPVAPPPPAEPGFDMTTDGDGDRSVTGGPG